MFLATTALEAFWDRSQEILYLGSWCFRNGRRAKWEELKASVMPSPWDDRERFYAAARYLDRCYEQLLLSLAEYFNAIHHLSHSPRYWRILIGPWLLRYLHTLYDRYIHLKVALDRERSLETLVMDPNSYVVPYDASEFARWTIDDPYNLQLFSQLLVAMGYTFPSKSLSKDWAVYGTPMKGSVFTSRMKGWARGSLRHFEDRFQTFLSRWATIALCEVYLSRSMKWKVIWHMGCRAFPFAAGNGLLPTHQTPVFDGRRNGLASFPADDEFERLAIGTLPQNLPILYLEGFERARAALLARIRRLPRLLVSANGWYVHESVKFLAAEASERGNRLIAVQHGGGYGMYRFMPSEQHELAVSDSYYVWGWADPRRDGRLRNAPAPQLARYIPRRSRPCPSGSRDVLYVATTNPRYVYRFYSAPQGTQLLDYFQWQTRFFQAVPNYIRVRMRFRDYDVQFGHYAWQRLRREFPELRRAPSRPLHRVFSHCWAVVIDHLGTAFLEALVANVPTLLFWDTHRWEVREEVEPFLQELRRVRVFHDSPEDAVAQLSRIYLDPLAWWRSDQVQAIVSQFVRRHAQTHRDWVRLWASILREELECAGAF